MTYRTFFALALVFATVACCAAGCASRRPLQIETVGKKGRTGTIVAPKFTDSYYYFDREHTLFFIMRDQTTDKVTGKKIEQVATLRVFWRPVGGKTTMDPTAINATYRYILMTPDSVGMYEGAGFVRLFGSDGTHTLYARLMDGDLRLTQASTHFVDTIGRARIHGAFQATYNDAKALDMILAEHREFFARSLNIKPVAPPTDTSAPSPVEFPTTSSLFPSTQPATSRAATKPAVTATQP